MSTLASIPTYSATELLQRLGIAHPAPVSALPVVEPLQLPAVFRLAFARVRALNVPYMSAAKAIGIGVALTFDDAPANTCHPRADIARLLRDDIELWFEGRHADGSYLIDLDRLSFDLGLNIALGLLSGEFPAAPRLISSQEHRARALNYAYSARIYFGADDDAEDRRSDPDKLCTQFLAYQEACEEYCKTAQNLDISATNAAFEAERTRLRA